jgi:curved DNA-binding protein CbpA
MQSDPFAELGLPALAELTDDDVRAAWRRIAAATHPDREDGGDPARFGSAAAAYALLRTSFGRGEALADLSAGTPPRRARRARRARRQGLSWPPHRLWSPRRPWYPWRSWFQQRPGAHRQHTKVAAGAHRPHAATPGNSHREHAVTPGSAHRQHAAWPAGARHSGDARSRHSGGIGYLRAGYAGFLQAVSRFLSAVSAGFRPARYMRFRPAGLAGLDRGLVLPAGAAALAATAAVAAVGWTPATIGLVAGALTVTGWGLWRRAWRDR